MAARSGPSTCDFMVTTELASTVPSVRAVMATSRVSAVATRTGAAAPPPPRPAPRPPPCCGALELAKALTLSTMSGLAATYPPTPSARIINRTRRGQGVDSLDLGGVPYTALWRLEV